MGTTHKLGFGNGTIIENEDGTASYRKSATLSQVFRVRIEDITGFSVSKGSKALERTLKILGSGTELASVSVPHGTSEKIEGWFRSHPNFNGGERSQQRPSAHPGDNSVADELTKLAALRTAGVLNEDEFAREKAKLLG